MALVRFVLATAHTWTVHFTKWNDHWRSRCPWCQGINVSLGLLALIIWVKLFVLKHLLPLALSLRQGCFSKQEELNMGLRRIYIKRFYDALLGFGAPSLFPSPRDFLPCWGKKKIVFERFEVGDDRWPVHYDLSLWLPCTLVPRLVTLAMFRVMELISRHGETWIQWPWNRY